MSSAATPKPAPTCPECAGGKCVNCTVETLDIDDQWGLCSCPKCGGGMAGFMSTKQRGRA